MSSFRDIATKMDSVNTPSSLGELIAIHRWYEGEERSFRAICERHDSPSAIEQRFLFLNTFLMDVDLDLLRAIGGPVVPVVEIFTGNAEEAIGIKKPAVNDRAPKIGELIRDNYDIALLAEIFEDEIKERVLSAWSNSVDQPFVVEDAQSSSDDSSGLVTISNRAISLFRFHEYEEESGLLDDGMADKGVMLSRMPIGTEGASLELYNTHLDSSDVDVRAAQISELSRFIESTHEETNVIILAGDFNIDSRSEEYVNLTNTLERVGLQDIWNQRNGTPGYTNLTEGNSAIIGEEICKEDTSNPDSHFCDDIQVPSPDEYTHSGRIDYIFISQPSASSSYTLDFTRPRRVRHKRRDNAPEVDKISFLSDHLGLATTLIISQQQ